MNSKLKILVEGAAGAIGGFLAWAIMEPIPFLTSDPRPGEPSPLTGAAFWWSLAIFGAIMGACIGAGIGAVEGLSTGSRRQFQRAIASGAVIGLAGGMAGLFFGQIVYQSFAPPESGPVLGLGITAFFQRLFARSVGWSLVGLFVGFAQSAPSGSLRKIKHGLIGGILGGALGGLLFQLLAFIVQTPELSRLVGITVTGGFVGFFVGLVQDLLKQAWVIVQRGRNEGRDYTLDKPVNILGRDELCDVGVFGDPAVAPQHAAIKVKDGRYVLEDLGSNPAGTLLNGQRVSSQGLKDGDVIQLGATSVVFHEKVGAVPVHKARDVVSPARSRGPIVSDSICAFCGQTKDPRTGACACTPVSSPAPGFAPATQGAGAPWGGTATGMPPAKPSLAPGAPATGGPRLVCVNGALSGQVIPLTGAEISIGREADRDLTLTGDPTVSRRHALLRAEGGGYALTDEGSANGVFVNEARVTRQLLRKGDRVRIGQSEFLYEA